MAIAQTTGGAANSGASNVASQASPSVTTTTGRKVVVVVILGSTSSSVSSITTSAGTYSWTLQVSKNGTGVRIEVWTSPVTTGAATVFTANITGGNTTCAIAVEEYSGVNSFGNTSSTSGSDINPGDYTTTQDGNNWAVAGVGFSCQSGDTFTIQNGTQRQSSIPAATAVGVALCDNTQVIDGPVYVLERISTARNWACASVELRSGGAAITGGGTGGSTTASMGQTKEFRYLKCNMPLGEKGPVGIDAAPVWGTFNISDGTVGIVYSFQWYLEQCATPTTYSVVSGSLPTGLSLSSPGGANEGQISGTPTVAGSYSFTLRATNSAGTADKAFSMTINAASASGGGSFPYIA